MTAVQVSLAALDQLAVQIDQTAQSNDSEPSSQIDTVNGFYRRLSAILENDA